MALEAGGRVLTSTPCLCPPRLPGHRALMPTVLANTSPGMSLALGGGDDVIVWGWPGNPQQRSGGHCADHALMVGEQRLLFQLRISGGHVTLNWCHSPLPPIYNLPTQPEWSHRGRLPGLMSLLGYRWPIKPPHVLVHFDTESVDSEQRLAAAGPT